MVSDDWLIDICIYSFPTRIDVSVSLSDLTSAKIFISGSPKVFYRKGTSNQLKGCIFSSCLCSMLTFHVFYS